MNESDLNRRLFFIKLFRVLNSYFVYFLGQYQNFEMFFVILTL
jgi:hypothetical protein